MARPGQFQLVPTFESPAPSGIVTIDRIRIQLFRPGQTVATMDTVVTISPTDTALDLNLTVAVFTAADTFTARLALVTPAGDTAFRGGPLTVIGVPSGGTGTPPSPPVAVPLSYVGVGAGADSVVITVQPPLVMTGDTALFQAVAYDNDAPVPGTPIGWVSLDLPRATVPKASVGKILGGGQRGAARIVAQLLTGPADTGSVTVQLAPAAIGIVSGNSQTATVHGSLTSPLVAQVKASDSVGVIGAWVKFSVLAGGGTLSADSALTDATGKASVQWTLGATSGAQQVRATTPKLVSAQATFGATALSGPPANIAINDGNNQSAAVGTAVAIAPSVIVKDVDNNPVANVQVDFAVTAGGGSLAGGSPITDAAGIARVGSWTLGTATGPDSVTATVSGVGPAAKGGNPDSTMRAPQALTPVAFGATAVAASAAKLAVTLDSVALTAGHVTSVTVTAKDPFNNTVASYIGTIHFGSTDPIATVPANYTFVPGDAGVHTFSNGVTLKTAGNGVVGATDLANGSVAGSDTATVTHAPASSLLFTVQPSNAQAGVAMSPAMQVGALDPYANPATSYTGTVSLVVANNPGGATLSGTTSVAAVGGIASFSNLIVNGGTATGYTLSASASGLSSATSGAFAVSVGTPTDLALFAGDGQQAEVSTLEADSVAVKVTDSQGNPVPGVAVSWGVLTGGGGIAPATSNTNANGVAIAHWTMGAAVGDATAQAAVAGLIGSPVVLHALAVPPLTTKSWNGSAGTAWTTGANWTPSGVPGSGDRVFIPAPRPNLPSLSGPVSITDLILQTGATLNLGSSDLTASGNVAATTISGTGRLILGGTGSVSGSVPNLQVSGTYTLAGNTTVGGKLVIPDIQGGPQYSLTIGDKTLDVGDSLVVDANNGPALFLTNAAGRINAHGHAVFRAVDAGVNTASAFTAGEIHAFKDFTQTRLTTGSYSHYSFVSTGTRVFLDGTGAQTLTFSSPGSSVLKDLVIGTNGGSVILASPIVATGQLIEPATAVTTVSGAGNSLAVAGLDVDGIVLDNVPLNSTGGTLARFDNVTFQNYAPDAVQFTLAHPGAATSFIFNNLQFLSAPVSGRYISATDNVADANVLTIDLAGSNPGDGSLYTSTAGGGVVNWSSMFAGNNWINPAGGNWSNTANWSLGHVPNGAEAVAIQLNGTYTVNLDVPAAAPSLLLGGSSGTQTLNIGNTLTLNGGSTVGANGALNLSSGTLTGSGPMTVNGAFDWSGGTLSGAGTTTIGNTGSLTLTTGNTKVLSARTINNSGTITWTNTGWIDGNTSPVINNLASGVIDATGDALFRLNGTGAPTVNNSGVIRKSAGGVSEFQVVVNNQAGGSIQAQTGTLRLSGGGTSTAGFTTAAGATLAFTGGTHTLDASSSVSGAGNVDVPAGTVSFAGTYAIIGATNVIGGTANFNASASTTSASLTSGTLGGSAALAVSGAFSWTGGTMSGTGSTNIGASGSLALTTGNTKVLSARTINNSGTITWASTGWIDGNTSPVINNLAGATFDATGDALFRLNGTGIPTFNNAGVLRKSAGSAASEFQVVVNNQAGGVILAQVATLRLSAGGVSTSSYDVSTGALIDFGGGTHTLDASSSVTGAGTVLTSNGAVTFSGTYNTGATQVTGGTASFNAPATTATGLLSNGTLGGTGTLTVNGAFTWSGGTMAGSGSTNIAAAGSLALTTGNTKALNARTINNSGTISWTNTGWIDGSNSPVVNNLAGATFDASGDALFRLNGTGIPTLNNAGVIRKSAGTTLSELAIVVNNQTGGSVQVQAASLRLSGGGTSVGSFDAASGTILQFAGGNHALNAGSSVTAAGTIQATGGNVDVNGSWAVAGSTDIAGGTINFDTPATTVNGSLVSGTLGGTSTFTASGTFNWTGGTMAGSGATIIQPTALLDIYTGNTKGLNARTINNSGTTRWRESGWIDGSNSPVFNNLDGGLFVAKANGNFRLNGTGIPVFNNYGTVLKDSATTSAFQINFATQAGADTILVNAGTLLFQNGAGTLSDTIGVAGGAALDLNSGNWTLADATRVAGGGRMMLTGGTLNVGTTGTDSVNVAVLLHVNGTLTGPGSISLRDTLVWSAGVETGAGRTWIPAGAVASLETSNAKVFTSRTINNAGQFTWRSSGFIDGDGSTFNNLDGAVFRARANGTFRLNGAVMPVFNNQGTILKDSATTSVIGVALASTDTVLVNQGILQLATATGSLADTVGIAAGAELNANSGNWTLANGTRVAGSGRFTVSGGTMTVGGSATDSVNVGILNFANGTLTGLGNIAVHDSLIWSGGTMSGAGRTWIPAAAVATLESSNTKFLTNRTINNAGQFFWRSSGFIDADGSTFNNLNGGFFLAKANGTFRQQGAVMPVFNNQGTIAKDSATTSVMAVNLASTDTVLVNQGTLQFATATGTLADTVGIAAGAQLNVVSGNWTLANGVHVLGGGRFGLSGGTLNTGTSPSDSSDLGIFAFANGTVTGPGNIAVHDSLIWNGGTMSGAGRTWLTPAAVATLETSNTKVLTNRTVNNAGHFYWRSSGWIDGDGLTFNNLDGALFEARANATFRKQGTVMPVFNNQGTLRKDSATTSTVLVTVNNSDTLDVATGTLLFGAGATVGNTATSALLGAGTLDIVNATGFTTPVRIDPAGPGTGTLTVNKGAAAFDLPATAVVHMDVAGTSAYDKLVIAGTGNVTLAGELQLAFGAYTPPDAETYQFLNFPGKVGAFASITGLTPAPDLLVDVVTGTANVIATVTTLPAGTDVVWTGAADTDWDNPANWNTGVVPDGTKNVYIKSSANHPQTSGGAATQNLVLQTGVGLSVSANDTLTVSGNLDGGHSTLAGLGLVRLTGTGKTLKGSSPTMLVEGTYDLADSLKVTGSLIVRGPDHNLNLNGHRALVSIDFATDSAGTLTMLNPADTLDVGASVLFMGGNTSGQLAEGRILLRGDFNQSGIVHAASCGPDPIPDTVGTFFATGAHRVEFVGSTLQHVMIGTPGPDIAPHGNAIVECSPPYDITEGSRFAHIMINNPSGVQLSGQTLVTGDLDVLNGPIDALTNSATLSVAGNLNTSSSLSAEGLQVGGALAFTGGTYDVNSTAFIGPTNLVPTGLPYRALALYGSGVLTWPVALDLSGGLLLGGVSELHLGANSTVVSATVRDDAKLVLGGHKLQVSGGGTFITTNNGTVQMTSDADTLDITGYSYFQGGDTQGLLTAGTILLGGLFNQSYPSHPRSFHPTGTNRVVLNGTSGIQQITFDQSGTDHGTFTYAFGDSRFRTLEVTNPNGFYIGSDVYVQDSLIDVGTISDNSPGHRLRAKDLVANDISYLENLEVAGTLGVATGLYNVTTTIFSGASQSIPLLSYNSVTVSGTATLPQDQNFHDLTVTPTGHLDIGPHQIVVNGNVNAEGTGITASTGFLRMIGSFTRIRGTIPTLSMDNTASMQVDSAVTVNGNASIDGPLSFGDPDTRPTVMRVLGILNLNGPQLSMHEDLDTLFASTHIEICSQPSDTSLTGGVIATPDLDEDCSGFRAFGTHTLLMTGSGNNYLSLYASGGHLQNLAVGGSDVVSVGSSLDIGGNVLIGENGTLEAADSISIAGNLSTVQSGVLRMQTSGTVAVAGSADFLGGNTAADLTDGVLAVAGNFVQGGASPTSFAASGNHTTILNGNGATQIVSFAAGDTLSSHFNNLQVMGTAQNVQLWTDVAATGQLIVPCCTNPTFSNGNGGVWTLTTKGLNVNGANFDGVLLASVDGTYNQFNTVNFAGYRPNDVRFSIRHPGLGAAPLNFFFLSFDQDVTPPGYWIKAEDSDGALPLAINAYVGSSPGCNPADPRQALTDGIASVTFLCQGS